MVIYSIFLSFSFGTCGKLGISLSSRIKKPDLNSLGRIIMRQVNAYHVSHSRKSRIGNIGNASVLKYPTGFFDGVAANQTGGASIYLLINQTHYFLHHAGLWEEHQHKSGAIGPLGSSVLLKINWAPYTAYIWGLISHYQLSKWNIYSHYYRSKCMM